MHNIVKTTLLLTTLTILLLLLGQAVGGRTGAYYAFIFACIMNFGAYWFSDSIVLAMHRAQPLTENEAPEIYQMVREISSQAGIPMPRIFVLPSAAPNAFATGRNPKHAVVAVTQGIVSLLNYEELKGVLAHEIGHILNRDILISSIAATLAGAVSMLASLVRWSFFLGSGRRSSQSQANPLVLLLMAVLMPVAAALIQLAVSRSREYGADDAGAKLCGNPLYLANALRKLERGARQTPMQGAHPNTAHLFIVNPLHGGDFASLFSTHPPIEKRIARLEQMAG